MTDISNIKKHVLDPLCVALVDKIFVKFALLFREYDSLYADPRRENAEKTQWVNAFMKHNIRNESQLKNAIEQTELHVYARPPQLGQFLSWCKKPIKPLSDTRPDWMKVKGIESDEHKAKKRDNALSHLSRLKDLLK
jgi:hypothetical protein